MKLFYQVRTSTLSVYPVLYNFFSQILAAFLANIGFMSSGLGIGYMGPYGEIIMATLDIDKSLKSLLYGSVSVGGLVGCLLGKLADIIGRKWTIIMLFSLISIGWLIVALSVNFEMILSGTILHGVGEGLASAVFITYLGEVISEKYRGGTIASAGVACIFGIVLAYILGLFLPWQHCAGCIALMNFLCLLSSALIQESEHWQDLRVKLKKKTEDTPATETNISWVEEKEPSGVKISFSKATILSTCIPPFLLFMCPLTGLYSISFYALSLLDTMNIGQPAAVAIAVGLVRTLGCVCAIGFVQKYGRRLALIFSAGIATILLFTVSVLLHAQPSLPAVAASWSLIILLVMLMFTISLGMTQVPWILCGEWPDTKYKVSSISC